MGLAPVHQTRSITPHLLELTVLHRLSLHHLTLQCGHLAAVLVQLQGTGEEGWGGQRDGGGVGEGWGRGGEDTQTYDILVI